MYNKKLTKEDIERVVNEVFSEHYPEPTVSERKIVGLRGCVTDGMKDLGDFTHCGDKDCSGCNSMAKAIEQAIKDWGEE